MLTVAGPTQPAPTGPKPPASRGGVKTQPPASPIRRIGATLIDFIPILIIGFIICGLNLATAEKVCSIWSGGYNGYGCLYSNGDWTPFAYYLVLPVLVVGYFLWNWGRRQGKTGSTIGQSVLKFKVVRVDTSQPIGLGAKRIVKIVACALVIAVVLFRGVEELTFWAYQYWLPGAIPWKKLNL
jgi:hypothetical protein